MNPVLKGIAASLIMSAALFSPNISHADVPVLTINSPSGSVVYVPSFPANITLSFDVQHFQGLNTVHPVRFELNDVALVDVAGNAFTDTACTAEALSKFNSCTVSGSTATMTKQFSVQAPGTYAMTVQARHRNSLGEDEAIFDVVLLQVEYPAPPAEANKHIQETWGKMPSACRGAIISQIAENHAKLLRYGPRGGPYNIPMIQLDVNTIKTAVGC